jgi:hypothetical protein
MSNRNINSKNLFDPLNDWKSSKSSSYLSMLIGILIIIGVTTLILWGLLVQGMGVFGDEILTFGADVEKDPGKAYFFACSSLILYNLLGFIFIWAGIMGKNRLAKAFKIEKTLISSNYSYDNVRDIIFKIWVDMIKANKIEAYCKEYKGAKSKKMFILPKKNIRILYVFSNDNDEPKRKYRCFVEIKSYSNPSFLSNTMKHVKIDDLLEITQIIDRIFKLNTINKYFQHPSGYPTYINSVPSR